MASRAPAAIGPSDNLCSVEKRPTLELLGRQTDKKTQGAGSYIPSRFWPREKMTDLPGSLQVGQTHASY
jgi:hypothetical protein